MLRKVTYSLVVVVGMVLTTSIYLWSKTESTELSSRSFRFSYEVEIGDLPNGAKDLEIWIPSPQSDQYQTVLGYDVECRLKHDMIVDPVYGNSIFHFVSTDPVGQPLKVKVDFEITRGEDRSIANEIQLIQGRQEENLSKFLAPNSLVPVDGPIVEEANRVLRSDMTDLEKMETLYRHLLATMQYDKTGEGWGHGDALYACDVRKGNCTDIHSLFIGMARSQGIPARFVIGFPLPPARTESVVPGYHCWAEFYLPDKGWVPVDISEAIKHPEKSEYYFGRLDRDRIAFTTGRDIPLKSLHGQESLNYFIYPFVLVDGKPFANVEYKFGVAEM